MPTTWTIAIDWDRNGNFTDTYDDVTSRITQINWFLGMRKAYQDAADNSMLGLTLLNNDKLYSPEYVSSPLFGKIVPQRPVRIQSNDGTTTRTHWTGWIEAIQPAVNQYGQRITKIMASGPMQFYKAAETHIPLQENKRSDEIIATLLQEVVIPPALSGAWLLGYKGNSELGVTTYLANTTAYSTLDTGNVTFGIAGDNWVRDGGLSNVSKDTFDVYQAISEITSAEHGKFLFARDGKALFWNRHHLLDPVSPVATFNDNMTDMAYTYANVDQTQNEVIVISHPRTIGTVTTDILWQLGNSIIRVNPGETKTIYIKYEDEGKNRIGGKDVTVTDLAFDQGSVTVIANGKANGVELTLINGDVITAIVTSLIVRGRKIQDKGEMEAKAVDSASVALYGRRTLRINLPSIDNLEKAQSIADFERDRRGKPRGDVNSITMLSHAINGGGQHSHQLTRTLGDLITVQETQTGHSKNYYIVGEAHEINPSIPLWKTTWYLEVAPTVYPWKLGAVGYSELGVTTRVTY